MIKPTLAVLITWIVIACRAMGQGSVCAHGGGADWELESHREMVRWMINQAAAGREGEEKVRVVVLGAVPREPDDPDAAADAFRREGAEAAALVIVEDNADDPETGAAIEAADVVWIRGGNQWRYVNWWKDTATERAIRKVFERGGVVGGTSAGCAVLGEVTYDARNGSLRPEQALADSHHENLTLTDGFLNIVPGVLFDSHFTERGRIGRLPVMMARAKVDFGKDVLGVGIDEGTAVLISPATGARIIGNGGITVLSLSERSQVEAAAGHAPRVTDVRFDWLAPGCEYGFPERKLLAYTGTRERRDATPPKAQDPSAAGQGQVIVKFLDDFWGREGGTRAWMPRILDLLRTEPHAAVLIFDAATTLKLDVSNAWIRRAGDAPASAVLVLRTAQWPEPKYRERKPPQELILNAALHILPEGWGVNPASGTALAPPSPDPTP